MIKHQIARNNKLDKVLIEFEVADNGNFYYTAYAGDILDKELAMAYSGTGYAGSEAYDQTSMDFALQELLDGGIMSSEVWLHRAIRRDSSLSNIDVC